MRKALKTALLATGVSLLALVSVGVAGAALARPLVPIAAPAAKGELVSPQDAIKSGDFASLVAGARTELADSNGLHPTAWLWVSIDDVAKGNYAAARKVATDAGKSGRALQGVGPEYVLAWVDALEGRPVEGAKRLADHEGEGLSSLLRASSRLWMLEASGDVAGARLGYQELTAKFAKKIVDPKHADSLEGELQTIASHAEGRLIWRFAELEHRAGNLAAAEKLYREAAPLISDRPNILLIDPLKELASGKKPELSSFNMREAMALSLQDLVSELEIMDMFATGMALSLGADREFPVTTMSVRLASAELAPRLHFLGLNAAQVYLAYNHSTGALTMLKRIPDSAYRGPDARLAEANAYVEMKDYKTAQKLATKAGKLAPDRYEIAIGAAFVSNFSGDPTTALKWFDKAMKLTSTPEEKSFVNLSRARALYYVGRMTEAAAAADAALLDQPDFDSLIDIGSLMVENKPTRTQGLNLLRRAVDLRPESPEALNALGYSLLSEADKPDLLDEAFRMLTRAVKAAPLSAAIQDSMGWAYYLYADYPKALEHISRATDLMGEEKNPEILEHYGDILWRLDRKDDARARWREGLEARPDARRKTSLEARLRDGLTDPAPVKRATPPEPKGPEIEA